MALPFAKYQGAGNDFILIDDRTQFFPLENSSFIARLCHRQFGIGADGLILLQPSARADFRMRIFNSDGKEAAMCGNGLRCLIRFIHSLTADDSVKQIETHNHIYQGRLIGDQVGIDMQEPVFLFSGIENMDVVDTGVPHAVIFVSDLKGINVLQQGAEVRYHHRFAPHGVNVNFATVLSENEIGVRTYERGVEAETLACGTGATAVAYVANKRLNLSFPLHILPASGDRITIDISENKLQMIGPAEFVYTGSFYSR